MARKESVTVEMILDTAFEMTRQEGFANVTARKVAAKAGCSTQPIFRVYKNMEELWNAVYEKAASYFQDFYSLYPRMGKAPFSNLGMAYIAFAREERHLFELLFVSEENGTEGGLPAKKSMYELLNGTDGNVGYEISLAQEAGCPAPGDLFMKMWIFIHGAACMSLTGDYDLSDRETLALLENSYHSFAKVR
jgi:AcrR family transcriptional regulator